LWIEAAGILLQLLQQLVDPLAQFGIVAACFANE
jgi:hypothetical protein